MKRYISRIIIAVTIPTVIVGITILLDEPHSVGYGLNGVCWIDSFSAHLGSYITPIGILFLITISLLVYTIYKISYEDQKNRKVATEK